MASPPALAARDEPAARVEAARAGALVHAAEETAWLLRLGAFTDEVPPEVRALPERLALPVLSRDDMIDRLEGVDAKGVRDLAALSDLGVGLAPPVRTVLGPLPRREIDALRANDPPDLLARPHVDALEILRRPLPDDAVPTGAAAGDTATDSAAAASGRRSAGIWPAVAALGGVALLGAGIALWRMRRATGRLAYVDELTGVCNRRRLDRDLAASLRDAGDERPVTLAMVDIDHFKALNDEHGHLAGDEVLRTVAGIIVASVRSTDVVYRYGGEEFCVLLRDTGPVVAYAVAERLRHEIERAEIVVAPDRRVSITASIGLAVAQSEDVNVVLGDADRALYGAKRGGRNRVEAAFA